MRVLVACEESQVIAKAFRAKRHEAYSCDIQECSGNRPEWHIQGDAVSIAYGQHWDLMIAHPPCTFMSRAGARWMYPQSGKISTNRLAQAMEAKAFFDLLLNAPIEKIAIENPLPMRIIGLPKETQVIQPYQYGELFSKKTLLWLKNLPLLMPTDIVSDYQPYLPSNTGGAKRGQKFTYRNISQKQSSKTFPGIAAAMADQWG